MNGIKELLDLIEGVYDIPRGVVLFFGAMEAIFVMRLFSAPPRTIALTLVIVFGCLSCFVQPDPPEGWTRARFSWICWNFIIGGIISGIALNWYEDWLKRFEERVRSIKKPEPPNPPSHE